MVKKAHLVTGKGGVGKSLFAAVLAYHFSLENQHILLTELNEHSFYKDFLKLPEINYKPLPWINNIEVAQWAPEECLKEYARHLLKIESLYKLFIENPVSKSLIQVAPGLQELALLGKLTSSPRKHGPPMNFDQVVVDSFSTGHFLSLLRAPAALQEAIPFGPMGEQTKGIDLCIRNPEFTTVHLVCLPEELPVAESIELYYQLKKEFNITPRFYLNKMLGLNSDDFTNINTSAKESLLVFFENEIAARKKLTDAKIQFIELPLITDLNLMPLVQKLAQKLKELYV